MLRNVIFGIIFSEKHDLAQIVLINKVRKKGVL